ncbi:hypothetical protein DSM03_11445 [Leeuwenhoekiella aestuarii]|uniref:Phosphate-selective porin O/P n=2 Tax=Leeuwenhoekiella aestuarii TaxID=2249426 RepID=A0A4Q0NTX3_9FLAO|nr:hypothetical protein DSM03_11445 [Leeuwenhoekiella aestuarii]RXG15121.1 hypothetical protein DSM04_1038 [Leeuwenhoekiella aestuarii]
MVFASNAQQKNLQYFRPNSQLGLNVFETSKEDTIAYEGVRVRVGGDFAMQFQSLDQSNDANNLVELGSDFNLPSANLNLDVQLIDGVRMHLKLYLSSQHHEETWVKGGHIQIDKLDFVSPGLLEELMKYTTITIGLDEFNYGDAHFRRTDNARAIFNPFVGNYIMDSFSTEAFGEITLQKNGLLLVAGITNGKLNQSVTVNENTDNKPSFYGKIGFDESLGSEMRFRLTGSIYSNHGTSTGTYLYGGDRTGGRYYNVLHTIPDVDGATQGGEFEGRFNPRFKKLTAFQINPFIKYKGIEFFGIFERALGSNTTTGTVAQKEGDFTQLAGELVYRFGQDERFFIAGRYNTVKGQALESDTQDLEITRLNLGGGWFLSKNIVLKAEYVDQNYKGNAWTGRFAGAQFDGVNLEAAISF